MMFLFAWLGQRSGSSGWPIHLMHQTETAFVVVALVCVTLAIACKRLWIPKSIGAEVLRGVIAFVGGVSASFGLIMPFELAPFFFHSGGEIMMVTMALNLAYLPVAGLFMPVCNTHEFYAQDTSALGTDAKPRSAKPAIYFARYLLGQCAAPERLEMTATGHSRR